MDAPHNWKTHLQNSDKTCSVRGCPRNPRYTIGYRGLGLPTKTSQELCQEHVEGVDLTTHFLMIGTIPVTDPTRVP